jgi:hypothetical protein
MRIIRHSPGLPITDPDRLIGPVLPVEKATGQDMATEG